MGPETKIGDRVRYLRADTIPLQGYVDPERWIKMRYLKLIMLLLDHGELISLL